MQPSPLLKRLGVELPIVQAGMGGGLSRSKLAAAVSEAGGLGTLGMLDPAALAGDLDRTRERTGRPVAVNLLLPFTRAEHWRVAERADVVVTYWGPPRRGSAGAWLHQCGSVDEARAAVAAGADGVIVQGVDAGGHVRGAIPALELLARARRALPPGFPILLAGGVADATDVEEALLAGAEAAVLGTRFLMSTESAAHALYKERLVAGRSTVLTDLFGAGWPAPHRVLRNRATARWLGRDGQGPGWLRAAHRVTAPVLRRVPLSTQGRIAALQRPAVPLLSPTAPTTGSPDRLVEAAPLYAGETVGRMDRIEPAGTLVARLVGRVPESVRR